MKKFIRYADPAHSWVKVPLSLLKKLNIDHKISNYSYQRGDFVYLEEDRDLYLFVVAYFSTNGYYPQFSYKHTNRNSKIRSYQSYCCEVA